MLRLLLLLLCFSGCLPPEETCLLPSTFSEGEAARWTERGAVLLSSTAECEGAALCVRDRTVREGPADSAARGYCARPCELGCAPGTACNEVDGNRLCLHASN